MKSVEQIKKRLEALKPVLEKDFQVVTIGVFGSFCRGEQSKKSDVDILVEFAQDVRVGLFRYVELELFFERSNRGQGRFSHEGWA